MTAAEFAELRATMIAEYATEQVRAELLVLSEAREVAIRQMDELLPEGLYTGEMRFFTAEVADHRVVGHVWFAMREPENSPPTAWLYGIEVVPSQRGKGYGRALLDAVERCAADEGATSLGLNVFAGNTVARNLYDAAGYALTAQQLRKRLPIHRGYDR